MDSMLEEYIPVPCRPVFVTARRHISAAMLASIGELLSQVMMCGAWEDKAEAKKTHGRASRKILAALIDTLRANSTTEAVQRKATRCTPVQVTSTSHLPRADENR